MKTVVINKMVSFLSKYETYEGEDLEKLKYGLEGIYLTITKLVIILFLAIVLNILKEVILTLLFFNIIRYFGFGIHAKKSWQCLISSTICFIVLPYIMLNINISKFSILIIGCTCLIDLLIFAPADTVKRPLKNKKKRLIRKIATVSVAIIYIILSLVINNHELSTIFILSVIIESLMVNPLIYMLLNQPFNNYKHE